MKSRLAMLGISLTIAVLAGLLPLLSRADDASKSPTTAPSVSSGVASDAAPTTQQAKACNTKCPVTKEPVDSSVATTDYKGKTIGFCCSDCVSTFKKDPDKYMADLK